MAYQKLPIERTQKLSKSFLASTGGWVRDLFFKSQISSEKLC